MTEEWIEPPELLSVRLVLSTSAAVAVLLAIAGIVTQNPVDMAFVAVTVVLLAASAWMRIESPASIRFAATAARLSSLVWIWLVLKIDSPGSVAVAWIWIAVAICLVSARTLLRHAFPEQFRRNRDPDDTSPPPSGGGSGDGWIEELAF